MCWNDLPYCEYKCEREWAETCEGQFSPPIIRLPKIKLKSPGLAASAFTPWTILPTQLVHSKCLQECGRLWVRKENNSAGVNIITASGKLASGNWAWQWWIILIFHELKYRGSLHEVPTYVLSYYIITVVENLFLVQKDRSTPSQESQREESK